MTTTSLMPQPKQQFFSALGTPLLGGKLYTYAAGTSNPKATYTDAAGTIPQANPVLLNLRGEPASPIYWSGNYRVELRDALGNLIYSVDNFNTDPAGIWNVKDAVFAALGLADGSSKSGFTQGGAGAVLLTVQDVLRETISAKRFGAKGDGVNDDTAEIQAALDFGGAGSTVLFPPGVYKINGTLTRYPGQIIQGSGWADMTGTYNLQPGSTVLWQNSTADIPMIQAVGGSDNDQRQRGGLRDIALKHFKEGSTVGTAYKATNSRQNVLDNVYISSFNIAIEQGDNCWQWAMRQVLVMDVAKGLFSHDEGEDSTYTSCIFRPYRNGSIGVHMKNMSQTNLFLGCDFSNVSTGVLLEQGDNAGNGTGQPYPMHATFINCQFENSANEAIKLVSSNASVAMAKYHPQVTATGCRAFNSNSPNQGQAFITATHASFVEVSGLRSQGYSWGITIGANVGQVVWRPGPGAIFGSGDASGQVDRIFGVPSCRLQATAFNFVANNFTAIPYTTISADLAGWYSAPGGIKPARPGGYRAKASILVQAAPIGRYVLILKTNGGNDASLVDFYVSTAGQVLLISGDLPVLAKGTDVFSVVLYATASFAVDPGTSFFSMEPTGG